MLIKCALFIELLMHNLLQKSIHKEHDQQNHPDNIKNGLLRIKKLFLRMKLNFFQIKGIGRCINKSSWEVT